MLPLRGQCGKVAQQKCEHINLKRARNTQTSLYLQQTALKGKLGAERGTYSVPGPSWRNHGNGGEFKGMVENFPFSL